ncbi:hypothetical protein GCM10011320_22400 [Neoroseomonas lacus]|uniref:Uncharacterized protein n=1 Tax=Neoroseomonas lacus TaxID=287609 RepID=A0A917KJA8_9PROT|nr:hypothetical protein GCM10011320_22400 [Neoroseomonas lacus]
MRWTAPWIALGILLTSCAGTGSEGCDAWQPILVSASDGLTPDTARQILAHNRTGRRLCGW